MTNTVLEHPVTGLPGRLAAAGRSKLREGLGMPVDNGGNPTQSLNI